MEDVELVIKIPKKEFGIDIDNKFQDFFSRLRAEIKAHCVDNTSLVCGAYELETIEMLLNAFSNATPLPKVHEWIPVSERLPEEDKTVIASTDYFAIFPEARYTKDGWEWAYESGADYWEELKYVIAWMPLPAPYKEESEE